MKKIVMMLCVCLLSISLLADNPGNQMQVKVSVTAERNTFAIKKGLQAKAKKAAIKKYIQRLNAQTPEKLLEEASNEYEQFVDELETLDENWEKIDDKLGQLTGEYQVTLKLENVNQWLETKGFKQQAGIELVVMEEPPSLGQMKMDKAFGTELDGGKFFLQNYTTFQRRLRDSIVKKVGTFGFDVKLLADNELYNEFKTKDGTLVGVYFDVTTNSFVVNRDLLDAVKENNPDTIVLYYRVDSLSFDPQNRMIRATVAFNMKDLNTNVTKSVGAQSFQTKSNGTTTDMVIDDIVYCTEAAMNSLMNAEGAAAKLNNIAMSIKNAATQPKGPLKLIINAKVFDKKIRKKAMYMLKKQLLAKKVTSRGKIKSSNTTLVATVTNSAIEDCDTLYMEYVSPILEEVGVELDDDKVHYSGNTITIKP